jgi:hypothetical protein
MQLFEDRDQWLFSSSTPARGPTIQSLVGRPFCNSAAQTPHLVQIVESVDVRKYFSRKRSVTRWDFFRLGEERHIGDEACEIVGHRRLTAWGKVGINVIWPGVQQTRSSWQGRFDPPPNPPLGCGGAWRSVTLHVPRGFLASTYSGSSGFTAVGVRFSPTAL